MGDLDKRVLYCNGQFALINKYAGEVCSLPKEKSDCIFYIPEIFKNYFKSLYSEIDEKEMQCVNRIDRPVSGIVILALTSKANVALSQMVKRHTGLKKKYWAIVEGLYPVSDAPILLNQYLSYNQKIQKSFIESKASKGALPVSLKYNVIGAGSKYSFVEVDLITGRTHQIRCQLASQGMHIKGDLKYGAKRSEKNGGIRLHAASLSFVNPMNGETVTVEAPLPFIDPLWNAFLEAKGITV